MKLKPDVGMHAALALNAGIGRGDRVNSKQEISLFTHIEALVSEYMKFKPDVGMHAALALNAGTGRGDRGTSGREISLFIRIEALENT